MKQLKNFFRTLLVLFCTFSAISAQAQQELRPEYFDSVEVSLLTCSPHEEIYSLYGHSAIRWHDMHQEGAHTGEDLAFNWGIFNFDKPYFVARFVFGLTDYELGVIPYRAFCAYYEQWGSSVTEQVLNLTNEEKVRLKEALANNLLPENRIYRYNFFYDNCSTRPRDIVEKCINGKVEYAQRDDYSPSYREMVAFCTRNHPWATFGNDILLGVKADLKTDIRQQEFLPGNLLYDFDRARIYVDGTYRQLVIERRMAVNAGVQIIEEDFPLTPWQCACILLAITIGISIFDWKRKKRSAWYDSILLLMQGLAGCVLFVMLFSQHPTTSTNLQILLLNPLALGFIHAVIRKKNKTWPKIQMAMVILFFIGGIFQHYAEGMYIVALCLLLRVIRFEK